MKKIRKNLILLFIAVGLTLAASACSKNTTARTTAVPSLTPTAALTKPVENVLEPVMRSVTAAAKVQAAVRQRKVRDISSVELVKELKIGWSLGNTLDASGGTGVLTEISWGNPRTTKKMIDAVKNAGFNTVRIPVTWQPHIGEAPDYTIDKAWLDRVQQIVDWAYYDDMFVIINMHHENWYSPYYKMKAAAIDELKKTWKQIADRFEDYDEHLIFEGMNEPRHIGDPDEWTGGNQEGWEVVNELNAAFVNTIRAAGGNNPIRHLMLPPYAACSNPNALKKLIIPKDNKIIVSVHAYTPYNFALNTSGTAKWSASNQTDTYEIDFLMDNLNTIFIKKGIPVILGEFGAVDKDNTKARSEWARYYIKKAHKIGVPCIVWDNNSFYDGEKLGLLNRFKLEWPYPEIVESLIKGLK